MLYNLFVFQFKETIGRIIFIKKAHLSKWALYIQDALKIINKNVVKMTTSSLASHYIKEGILQRQFKSLPDLPFVYQIGDYVVLKSLATRKGQEEKDRPGFKRSLGRIYLESNKLYLILAGYDEGLHLDSKDEERSKKEVRQIRERKWVLGSSRKKDTKNVVQIYKVTGSREWFPLTDLAPRLNPTSI